MGFLCGYRYQRAIFFLSFWQLANSLKSTNSSTVLSTKPLWSCRHNAKFVKLARLASTCSTCIAFVPATALAFKHRLWPPAINLAGSVIFSTLYHYSDSLKAPIFGVQTGRWHQLDNIFSIASVGSLILHITLKQQKYCFVGNFFFFLSTLYLQITDPWNLRYGNCDWL